MRNFEERKAEVFRRSEKRIKERKQRRRRVLMTCVPLVLCLTVFGAFLFPQLYNYKQAPESMPDPFGTQAAMGQDDYQSLTCSIAEIKVSGNGISIHYTDVTDLLLISDQLNTYSAISAIAPEANGTASEDGSDRKENVDDAIGSIADSANAAYTITLITHEGVKTEYQLFGNTLRNKTTNQAYTLTYEQAKELRGMLGVPQ